MKDLNETSSEDAQLDAFLETAFRPCAEMKFQDSLAPAVQFRLANERMGRIHRSLILCIAAVLGALLVMLGVPDVLQTLSQSADSMATSIASAIALDAAPAQTWGFEPIHIAAFITCGLFVLMSFMLLEDLY